MFVNDYPVEHNIKSNRDSAELVQGEFGLDHFRDAWDVAADTAGFSKITVMKP